MLCDFHCVWLIDTPRFGVRKEFSNREQPFGLSVKCRIA
jgi:hypothetical protein